MIGSLSRFVTPLTITAGVAAAAFIGTPVSSADINGNSDQKSLVLPADCVRDYALFIGTADKKGVYSLKEVTSDGSLVTPSGGPYRQVVTFVGEALEIAGPAQKVGEKRTYQGVYVGLDDHARLEPVTPVTTSRPPAPQYC